MIVYIAKKVSYHPDIAFRVVDGLAVVITPKDGVMHEMNSVGTKIWTEIDRRPTVSQVIEAVVHDFEVTREVAQEDVLGFVRDLEARGLVRLE